MTATGIEVLDCRARKTAPGSFVGTAIEWYDFSIYGTAAARVLGKQFFPANSDLAGTLAAFATLSVGFIARPNGGVVMGPFGIAPAASRRSSSPCCSFELINDRRFARSGRARVAASRFGTTR